MKTGILCIALAALLPLTVQAEEKNKTPYLSTEFKNGFRSGTVYARVYGQPETSIAPGESYSVNALPTAGGLFNPPQNPPSPGYVSVSMKTEPEKLYVVFSDSPPSATEKTGKTENKVTSTPDFEVTNDGGSPIVVQKTTSGVWTEIPSGQREIFSNMDNSGFFLKGIMPVIQIEQQKCAVQYCLRVLK
ncbi:hypothetical protein LIS66_01020 [Pseudomonas sp. HN2]|uniref:hypothetical protein n=1 Tax=Pseudomonas sp. HN2 TaxID=2884805 RepID=UPI001D1514ED|nr:hypothetical protein [Pseudomonas sp. HN2]UEB96178.1 hypothetical protein LIS66_01020 [Pseudomonas sp. HN2]